MVGQSMNLLQTDRNRQQAGSYRAVAMTRICG